MTKQMRFIAVASLLLGLPVSAAAFEVRAPHKSGNVNISADESPKDLYLAGGAIDVRADTRGDLVAAGGTLELSGQVEDDLLAAGGTITLVGNVGDTVRIAGGNVRIDAEIGGDLIVGAGNVILTKDAHVKGDLVVGAGAVTINGPVDGTVHVRAGDLTLASNVGGDLTVDGAETVTLAANAVVHGNFRYSATKAAELADGAQVKGETTFTRLRQPGSGLRQLGISPLLGLITVAGIFSLIGRVLAIALLALLLLGLARPLLARTIQTAYGAIWPSLGLGLTVLIVVPIVLILCLITVVGGLVAGAGFLAYGLLLVVAKAATAAVIGAGLAHWMNKRKDWPLKWQTILLGALVGELLVLVPFVGWLAGLAFYLLTLGALMTSLRALKRV